MLNFHEVPLFSACRICSQMNLNDVRVDYNTTVNTNPIITIVTVRFCYALYERRWCTESTIEDNITTFFVIINTVHMYPIMWFCLGYLSLPGCYAVSTNTKISTFRRIVMSSHPCTSSAIIQHHLRPVLLTICSARITCLKLLHHARTGHPSTVIPRLTKIIRSGITFVRRNLR